MHYLNLSTEFSSFHVYSSFFLFFCFFFFFLFLLSPSPPTFLFPILLFLFLLFPFSLLLLHFLFPLLLFLFLLFIPSPSSYYSSFCSSSTYFSYFSFLFPSPVPFSSPSASFSSLFPFPLIHNFDLQPAASLLRTDLSVCRSLLRLFDFRLKLYLTVLRIRKCSKIYSIPNFLLLPVRSYRAAGALCLTSRGIWLPTL